MGGRGCSQGTLELAVALQLWGDTGSHPWAWGAGSEGPVFSVSHLYGFGLVDADALVVEAKKWMAVPPQHTCVAVTDKRPR